jgi:hypothetical protein
VLSRARWKSAKPFLLPSSLRSLDDFEFLNLQISRAALHPATSPQSLKNPQCFVFGGRGPLCSPSLRERKSESAYFKRFETSSQRTFHSPRSKPGTWSSSLIAPPFEIIFQTQLITLKNNVFHNAPVNDLNFPAIVSELTHCFGQCNFFVDLILSETNS